MANEIYQGDSGTVISITIRDDNQPVDLTGTTVDVLIKLKDMGKLKSALITDHINGKCEFTLLSEDIMFEGIYNFQATVNFPNGSKFTSSIQRFTVLKKMGYIPSAGGTIVDITDSSTNGNIRVDGVEVKVYDDKNVKEDINDLKNSKHSHINQSTLNLLATDGTDLLFNSEAITFSNADILRRLGISTNGILTVDGAEIGVPSQDKTAPSDVTNLTTSNLSTASVILSWSASTSEDVVGYEIYNGSTLVTSTANTSYTIIGLLESTQYTFTVKAKDAAGNLSSGISVSITTIDGTAPDNVTGLTVSNVTQTTLTLSWNASLSSDILSYDIYQGDTLLGNVTGNIYNVSGLTDSTQYTFTIKSKDTTGNVSNGSSVTIRTVDATSPIITISPNGSNFNSDIYVTLSSNENATIYYSLDGSDPSLVYNGAIKISATNTIKYYGVDFSNNSSAIQSAIYTLDTFTPINDIDGGSFTETPTSIVDGGVFTESNTSTIDGGTFADVTAPNNVTNLTKSNVTANSLTLTWDASTSTDVSSYDIYNGTTLLGNTTSTTYNIVGLSEKTTYTLWVKARDAYGNVASGTSVTATTLDVTAPVDVTNLEVSNILQSSLTLTWNASTSNDVNSYDVYNGTNLVGNVTGTTCSVTGLSPNASYTFTVKSKDGSGNISTGVSITTTTSAPDTTAPNEVTNLVVNNITQTGATLSWTASTSSDISSYGIYNGGTFVTEITGNSYDVTGLTANTSYTFTVKSKDTMGNISNGASVTLTTSAADTTPPSEVTNLATSNVLDTSLTLTWTASVSSDIASYDVYNGATLLGNTTSTTYNVTGLTANTAYTFTVKSKDTSGNVSTGASISKTTYGDTTPPSNVTGLNITNLADRSLKLNWTASSSSDVSGYNIYNGATLITTVTTLFYSVTGLTPSTAYTFWVKAKDVAGNEASGTSVNTTTNADTTAPVNVTQLGAIDITTTSFTLRWKTSTSTDTSSYDVYEGATLLGNTTGTTYSITGKTAGTSYTYTVKAKDSVGNISSGTTATVYTLASDVVWTKTYNAQTEQITLNNDTDFSAVSNWSNTASTYNMLKTDSSGVAYTSNAANWGLAITSAQPNFAISYKGGVGNSSTALPVAAAIVNGTGYGVYKIGANNNLDSSSTSGGAYEFRFEYRNGTMTAYVNGIQVTTQTFTIDSTNVVNYSNLMGVIGTIDNTKKYAITGGSNNASTIYDLKYGEWA